MKYSVNTWIYGGEPLEKTLTRLQRFGYDGVELTVMDPAEIEPDRIKRLVSDHGLVVSNLSGDWAWDPGKRDLCNPDEKIRQETIAYVKGCIELAEELGAISFAVIPSATGKPGPVDSLEDEWKRAVDAVAELAEYAEQHNVLLPLEPANRYEVYMLNTGDDALRFARDVGSRSVGVLLDCFHMNIEEPDLPLAFRKAGDLLTNVHIADSNRQAAGKGHTDFKSIIRTLKDIGYPYYLTMEVMPEGADPTSVFRGFTVDEDVSDANTQLCITLLRLYETLV